MTKRVSQLKIPYAKTNCTYGNVSDISPSTAGRDSAWNRRDPLQSMARISCVEPGRLTLDTCAVPVPGAGEALVRIRRVGIGGTGYHIVRGTPPYLS